MAEKLTPQQMQAVRDRGGRLLVSAAAGSGKTKVLVDRLLSYLTDSADPADLDDFLIITYTKAAAAELRGKIAAKLAERIAQEPENRHLQQQVQRLYLAKISTVHSFCADLLREYAYRLDIAPDFRVGDENECREMREMAMSRILDEAYDTLVQDEQLRTFVDTQGFGRDDRLVPMIVEKVYDSARCHKDPDAWLDRCLDWDKECTGTDASQMPWGTYLIERMKEQLELYVLSMERCVAAAEQVPEFSKVTALLSDTVWQLKKLLDCTSWDEIAEGKDLDFGRLTFPRKHDAQELADQIKAVRNNCKDGVEKLLKSFSEPSAQIAEDMEQVRVASCGLVRLVRRFSKEYDAIKRRRRILDFGDLEHRTLDLLLGKKRGVPTGIAREVGKRFREVLVDEYQDSNGVQDAIFMALTDQRKNCFMVGDVKQSIYQFRLADPGIFLDKYSRYDHADEARNGQGRKVLLSNNFRSGGAVLSAVNHVFRQCMSPAVGGLFYGDAEALYEGVEHIPLGEPEVELHAIDVREDTYEEEASYVAEHICSLLDGSHMVRQGENLRPILPEDIVILLRSPGSVGKHFTDALEQRGIRCASGGGQDLLQTAEIMTLRSLLQVIGNPRQDIPLISVLASPVFGFSADELAKIRTGSKDRPVYDSLLESQNQKASNFLQVIAQLRRDAAMNTLAQLLEDIFSLTHLDSIYAAMPDGYRRAENLRNFFQLAVDFEASGRRDLGQFLGYLELMEQKGLVSTGEQSQGGCVTIMSIHKSKGLEFPVVFLCGLGRKFNREDLKAQVLCDRELGLGLSVFDRSSRVRYPTIARRAIAARSAGESLSEELRVLYVGMTRARDRLIMTYADQRLTAQLTDIILRSDLCPNELLTRDVNCPGEWVLQAAVRRVEAGALFVSGIRPRELITADHPWRICMGQARISEDTLSKEAVQDRRPAVPSAQLAQLEAFRQYRYPHTAATLTPSKQTATQMKGREKDDEAAENTPARKKQQYAWRRASFTERGVLGKDLGNAIHTALQYIRYRACGDEAGIRRELERLVRCGFMSKEQAEAVDANKLLRFFGTELGRKLRLSDHVLREFKFSVLVDAEEFSQGVSGEEVLLQGVVDCALLEEDGITVIDFKTDRVASETLSELITRYRPQVNVYARAMSRIYQMPIKKKLLYLFSLEQFVEV